MSGFKLLTMGNPKTLKGEARGYLTFILHLAPANLSGYETCPKRTQGCTAGCLNTAGRGGMFKKGENTNMIQQARIRKTKMFFEDRDAFMTLLKEDINRAIRYAVKRDLTPVFRLNGTSDLSWEKYLITGSDMNVFDYFRHVQFYDYTKVLGRKVANYRNYHLTFSAADGNGSDVRGALEQGMNVAMVFDKLPAEFAGRPVINADETDLRFTDPKGVICGLKAKGRAKKDRSGFVIRLMPV